MQKAIVRLYTAVLCINGYCYCATCDFSTAFCESNAISCCLKTTQDSLIWNTNQIAVCYCNKGLILRQGQRITALIS